MSFFKKLFGKGKQPSPRPQTEPASTSRREGEDVQVDAIAIVSDMMMMFDSAETRNNLVANIVHAKWPGVKLPPTEQIEVTVGFRGDQDEAEAKLSQMLQQVMAKANLDQGKYRQEHFSVHSEVLSSTTWCAAAIRSAQPEVTGDMALFIGVFNNHLQRIKTTAPQLRAFLNQYFEDTIITQIAAAAADKMRLTLSDGEQHSTVFSQGAVIYHISTLPVDMGQARDWFGRTTGGYTKLLDNAWNSLLPQIPNCSVWCHIIYGSSAKGTWVHMAICSVKETAPINAMIVPIEFLTPQERQQLGL